MRTLKTNRKLPFNLLRAGEVMPGGWIREQMRLDLSEGITGAYNKISDNVNQNLFGTQVRKPGTTVRGNRGKREKAWWAGEHEGYWSDALLRTAILTGNDEITALMEKWLERILVKFDKTGYIGIYDNESRFPDKGYDGELWTQSRVFQALLFWYEYKGDERVLRAVSETVRKTIEHYRKSTYFGRPQPDGGVMHGVGYIDTLEWLYRLTKDSYFADAAVWLYEDYCKSGADFKEVTYEVLLDEEKLWYYHTPHVAEALHFPAVAAFFSEEEKYRKASENIPMKLARHTNPGGGFVAGARVESIFGTLGSGSEANEYCSKTEAVQSLNRYVLFGGDLVFSGAWAEKCTLNAGQGARFHPAMTAVVYLSRDNRLRADEPKASGGRELFSASHKAAACCTLNAMRLMPYYVEGMWLKCAEGAGLLANLYGASCVKTEICGISVFIEEKTDYPFCDKVLFEINPEMPAEFELMLRIPENSGEFKVEALDNADIRTESGIIIIRKRWQMGDAVRVDFDFQVVLKEQVAGGEYYYQWGPLVFSLPFSEKRTIIENIITSGGIESGYHEYLISPESETGWKYKIKPDTVFTPVYDENNSMNSPWVNPPVMLKGTMLDEDGKDVGVELRPLGSTILRRTTFPVASDTDSSTPDNETNINEVYTGEGGDDDPMRFF